MTKIKLPKIKTKIKIRDIPLLLQASSEFLWHKSFIKLKGAYTTVFVFMCLSSIWTVVSLDMAETDYLVVIAMLASLAAFPVMFLLASYVFAPLCLLCVHLIVIYEKKQALLYKAYLDAEEEYLSQKEKLTAEEAEILLAIMEAKEILNSD